MATRFYVDSSGQSKDGPRRVVLDVEYAAKKAMVELTPSEPLFDREPRVEVFRREP